jgi:(S)-2-hydroxy-acid oxidase
MILSSASSYSIEEVAAAGPNATKWFQMFLPNRNLNERNVSQDMIWRAEAAGFSAIVFTVDSPVLARRYSTKRTGFRLMDSGFSNFHKYGAVKSRRVNNLTWADFFWIKEMTRLPIVVKGILTAEDAREAVKAGISAIIVSNHGGRQVVTNHCAFLKDCSKYNY